ncbi:NAD-dependent protein deacylase [Rhizoctonia solani]|uniref:NAD-dependent protein deacylase n=1 Tax=Rhizoctonia solani TaxID=456999 RepID=A0A0K6FLU6_9AGAM|nr:NAD-dependent protein deacylase [Rhizoctonia solani]
MSSNDAAAFREVLRTARNVVILAGAGLSAASGIPTYRGSGGLWKSYDPAQLATFDAFRSNPGLVWMFYKDRIEQCRNARPNAAHRSLASLALPSVQARILPSLEPRATPPLLVTQNFDGLSVQALNDLESELSPEQLSTARSRLIEMHGSAFRTVCMQCKCTKMNQEPLSCPAFDDEYAVPESGVIPVEDLPKCGGREWAGSNRYGRCGGLLRPGVVWFGEAPEHQGEIARVFNWADVLLVVGTSALVHPAAGYVKTVKNNGGKVAIFNIEASSQDNDANFVFLGPCEETLPAVLGTADGSIM